MTGKERDEDIGAMKSDIEHLKKDVGDVEKALQRVDDKNDARHEESQRSYKRIVTAILITALTTVFGEGLVEIIMKSFNK